MIFSLDKATACVNLALCATATIRNFNYCMQLKWMYAEMKCWLLILFAGFPFNFETCERVPISHSSIWYIQYGVALKSYIKKCFSLEMDWHWYEITFCWSFQLVKRICLYCNPLNANNQFLPVKTPLQYWNWSMANRSDFNFDERE